MLARQTWYKDKDKTFGRSVEKVQEAGKQKQKKEKIVKTSSVMFVPSTRKSMLINKLKEKEEEWCQLTGFRIKYQEAGGTQLGNLFSEDLARDIPCGRR